MSMMRPEEEGEFGFLRQFIFDQRWLARQIVEDSRFNQAFLGITILNTLFLALAYDGERLWLAPFALNISATPTARLMCYICLQSG